MAASLAAACLAWVYQPAIEIWLRADYATDIAETREVHLEDGSIAFLGADSALEVAYEPGRRGVRLLSGEAYFEVQPDSARPFQVEAGNVNTTVLGTAFDVQLRSDSVSVAVNHGRVAVFPTPRQEAPTETLGAGDWARIDRDGAIERGHDAPDLVGGWRTGMLAVSDRAVSDVIEEVGRHYRGRIVIADGALADKRVTGVYDLNKPVDAVHAIAQAHGAHVRQVSPWLLVISAF